MSLDSLESRRLFAVTLAIDYSLDTAGFFNVPERRTAMAEAARGIAEKLSDTLAAVIPSGSNTLILKINHPSTSGTATIPDASVPADTIRIYVGGTAFTGSQLGLGGAAGYEATGNQEWFDLLSHRPSADSSNTVLEAPLAGSISFDATANWHFGLTTSGLSSNENDFLSVAQHELMHVLGFTSAADQFAARTSAGKFTGTKTAALFGSSVPLSSDLSHFKEGTISPGNGEAAMDPSLTTGTRKLLTLLDLAVLDDIGWTLTGTEPTEGPLPTALITGGPNGASTAEGTALTYSGATSTVSTGAIATYEWDTDYDGTSFTVDTTGAQLPLTAPDGPATQTIALRVTTAAGKSAISTQTLAVTNKAPTATLIFDANSATVTNLVDVDADLSGLTFEFNVNNDGSVEQSSSAAVFSLPTSAIQNDTRALKATVIDKDGGRSNLTATVTLPFQAPDPEETPEDPILTPDPKKKGKFEVIVFGRSVADALEIRPGEKNKPTLSLNGTSILLAVNVTRLIAIMNGGNDVVQLGAIKVPVFVDGGAGDDQLTTGSGKDVLVGGEGKDVLRSGAGEDLLVAGSYGSLTNNTAREALLGWNAKGKLASRVAAIADNTGAVFSATVVADTDLDSLFGDKSNDAFLIGEEDTLTPSLGKLEITRTR